MTSAHKYKSYVESVQDIRSSGAAGKHEDRRTKRLRTRKTRDDKAKEEYDDGQ